MQFLALLVLPSLMAYAAASDLLWMRLPNWLTLAVLLSFMGMAAVVQMPLPVIGWNLACAAIVLAGGFALFAAGLIGGGDAKLAAGVAAWLGFDVVLDFLLISAVLGAALTILMLQLRRLPLPAALHAQDWIVRLHDAKQGVPYGVALAGAALHLYPATQIWRLIAGQ